MLGVITS